MPKIIPELRESFIAAARKRILDTEEHDLTIRQIAADCGVAPGTVYNYFPSKDFMMAAVMLEDWQAVRSELAAAAEEAESFIGGLRAMNARIMGFVAAFRPVWQGYAGHVSELGSITKHHGELVEQISGPVSRLIERFGGEKVAFEAAVLSEMLLLTSQRGEDCFEEFVPSVEKIIQ